jgi:hypothetical protein
MRGIVLTAVSVLALATGVMAQEGRRGAPPPPPPALSPGASQADVDKALLAAPVQLRDQATVIKWKPDWTYDTLRKGTNRLLCFDKSGLPGQQPFSIECTSVANLDRAVQNMKFESEPDRAKRQAAIDAAEKDGTRAKPEFGSIWYHFMGPDQATARNHMTIAVPGATGASLGLPENAREGRVWVMNPGTSTAHLMVPGE